MFFKVNYSLDKDINCYLNFVWKFKWLNHGYTEYQQSLLNRLPENVRNKLVNTQDEIEAKKIIGSYLQQRYRRNKLIYQVIGQELEKYLNQHQSLITKTLTTVYQKPVPFPTVQIYLGTANVGPYNYNERWIVAYLYRPLEEIYQAVLHELNHFMFHEYYSDLVNQLSKEELAFLKESLTVLTNPEESGYPDHRQFRQWLLKQNKTIPEIIELKLWRERLHS